MLSSPTNINVQFVPTWGQVRADIKGNDTHTSHSGLTSAYLAAKLRSIINEIFSLGKIVTITGDSFESGSQYPDQNNNYKNSTGELTTKLVKYFDNHPAAETVRNAFSEFHNSKMGWCSNSGPSQFSGISRFFNSKSTFLYGNCFQGRGNTVEATSAVLNGARVIGSYNVQLDLPFLIQGRLSGNPLLDGDDMMVAKTNPPTPLDEKFLLHRVAQNGQMTYYGPGMTKVGVSGKISFNQLTSEAQLRKINDIYSRLGKSIIKNILSLIFRGY